jgi:hypothetical protein
MRRLAQLLSCHLALCVASTGLVGVSPMLHHLVEHGGRGSVHSHQGRLSHAFVTPRHGHSQAAGDALGRPSPSERPLTPAPSSSHEDSGHQHHSLPQLLANGLIEQHHDVPILRFSVVRWLVRARPTHTVLLSPDWNLQTASRGPPRARSQVV